MFQFPGCPSHNYGFIVRWQVFAPAGFPHSDICGSMPACGSPQLFAAYHVLLRQSVPGHPPCALIRLIYFGFHMSLPVPLLGHASTLVLSLAFCGLRFQSSSLSGFPSPRSRSQCASRLFSVQFSRNDLRPTPENDIVRKEEEPSVPSILVPFTRFPWRSTWDCDELLHHILPRKEVIQPHLPIRLPCYDFTPVIGLTFDG